MGSVANRVTRFLAAFLACAAALWILAGIAGGAAATRNVLVPLLASAALGVALEPAPGALRPLKLALAALASGALAVGVGALVGAVTDPTVVSPGHPYAPLALAEVRPDVAGLLGLGAWATGLAVPLLLVRARTSRPGWGALAGALPGMGAALPALLDDGPAVVLLVGAAGGASLGAASGGIDELWGGRSLEGRKWPALIVGALVALLVSLVAFFFLGSDPAGDGAEVEARRELEAFVPLVSRFQLRTGRYPSVAGEIAGVSTALRTGVGRTYVYRYASLKAGAGWMLAADPCPPRPGCPSYVVGSATPLSEGRAPFPLK